MISMQDQDSRLP
uniref:Uncharacterized protein n=1 Tax=Arundo donax TaxID=35708 RepID=A0A0A9EIM6_ARUDO